MTFFNDDAEDSDFEDLVGNYYGEDDDEDDRSMFADPGGESALRAAGPGNPRNLPCPTCGRENMLTPADRMHGYQCDFCANEAERGY